VAPKAALAIPPALLEPVTVALQDVLDIVPPKLPGSATIPADVEPFTVPEKAQPIICVPAPANSPTRPPTLFKPFRLALRMTYQQAHPARMLLNAYLY
jgi:hypothetical protein